jgi:hypothetical protein
MNGYVLSTSDARPKYSKDILNVLALPQGSKYQFRYENNYIPSDLKHHLAKNKGILKGVKVLIAFKSKLHENNFIVPIRWAVLDEIKKISDFYIIKFEIGNYPVVDAEPSIESICKKTNDFLCTLNAVDSTLPVLKGYENLVNPDDEERNIDAWVLVSKQLALHPTFSNVHFLRVSTIRDIEDKSLSLANNFYECKEVSFYNFYIDYYAINYVKAETEINIKINSELVRLASNSVVSLDSRYDSFKTSFQTYEVPGNSFAEISIFANCENDQLPKTSVSIPLKIIKSKNLLFLRIIASTLGATLLAIPSLLEPTTNKFIKVLLIALGALTLALGMNLIYPKNKK